MTSIPLADDLKSSFERANPKDVRVILVQNQGGILSLIRSLPPTSPDSTDKEDFNPLLAKLFSDDPQKSGYALFRLDTQAASGEWEWLCCAFQPDGAKIKEKMQYTATRTSLLGGLTERKFLDIIYGSTPNDFLWPHRLRNQRKHDYQNPQLKTAGLPASEAAGTGTGGAKRNFGSRILGTPAAPADEAIKADVGEQTRSTVADLSPEAAPITRAEHSEIITSAFKGPNRFNSDDEEESEEPKATQRQASSSVEKEVAPEESESIAEAQVPSPTVRDKVADEPSNASASEESTEALSQPIIPEDPALPQAEEQSKRPLASEKDHEARDPSEATTTAVATSEDQDSQPYVPKPLDAGTNSKIDSEPSPPTVRGPISAVGLGTGSGSILTRREEELAEINKLQAAERSSYPSSGKDPERSARLGFKWDDGVEEAICSLASTASGASEWNFVQLSLDLQAETLQVASPPRFVAPADLQSLLPLQEPSFALYRYEDISSNLTPRGGTTGGGPSDVVFIYSCPPGSSVRSRMLYSSNVLLTMKRADTFPGIRIIKKIETSEPTDITHSYIAEEVKAALKPKAQGYGPGPGVGSGVSASGGAETVGRSGFARPKKATTTVGGRR
ncbi:hypothetical protein IE53DRAFT_313943 [Violaceomyces palustris]|uniref:Uncharacterized protein n=1 Tax=Violaceomyces palustris TaxID=1673888 RepID=A0ACD0P085_9BASI|nr:hypothetical protein IE53DRAFT_313943 [Violaceomyces palustris]